MEVAQKDPAYLERLAKQSTSTGELGPEALSDLIKNDSQRWGDIIRFARIEL
jgi:tripartite-type tricarboxylate transporter receptor subunit TctC